MDKKTHPCQECGSMDEVVKFNIRWTGAGKNAFDFYWEKYVDTIYLCEECEADYWFVCYGCGALISTYDYGRGYLPEGDKRWNTDYICPGCFKNNKEDEGNSQINPRVSFGEVL